MGDSSKVVVLLEHNNGGTPVYVRVDGDGDVEFDAEGRTMWLRPDDLTDALKTLGILPRDTRPAPSVRVRSASDRVRTLWLRHARSDSDERAAIRDHVMRREVERCRRAEEERAMVWDVGRIGLGEQQSAAWEAFERRLRETTGQIASAVKHMSYPLSAPRLLADRDGDVWETRRDDTRLRLVTRDGQLVAKLSPWIPRREVETMYGPLREAPRE